MPVHTVYKHYERVSDRLVYTRTRYVYSNVYIVHFGGRLGPEKETRLSSIFGDPAFFHLAEYTEHRKV